MKPEDLHLKAKRYLELGRDEDILGEGFFFQFISQKHSEKVVEWRNKNLDAFENPRVLTLDDQKNFIENYPNNNRVDFILCTENEKAIGVFSLRLNEHQVYEVGEILGEESFKGKGLGLRATKVLIDFAKNELKVEGPFAIVKADNQPSLNFHKKLGFDIFNGFKKEGFVYFKYP